MFKPKIEIGSEKTDWLKEHYSILGAAKCSRIIGVSRSTCFRLAKAFRLQVPNQKRSSIARKNAYNQFKVIRENRKHLSKNITIKSPQMAYALGFLWGDGCLSEANHKTSLYYIALEILKEDYFNILPFLNSLGQWKGYERNRNFKPTFNAKLCDPVLGLFLKNNDYDKKSLVDPHKILSIIPQNLRNYWWRGYVDADGCFYIRKNKNLGTFTIVGDIKQSWKIFKRLLTSLKINYKNKKIKKKGGNCSIVTIHNRGGIILLGKYLYNGKNNICLKRKYEKFLTLNK